MANAIDTTGPADAGRFRSILFLDDEDPPALAEPACFHDLHLDQVVASATAGRDDYDLRPYFHCLLTSEVAVAYRQAVLRDVGEAPVRTCLEPFAEAMRRVRAHLRHAAKLPYREEAEWWFLHAASGYCAAVRALGAGLAALGPLSAGLARLRAYVASCLAGPAFTGLDGTVAGLLRDLAAVRYAIRIRDGGFTVQPFGDEADYSTEVEAVFERFRQGTVCSHKSTFAEPDGMNHIEAKVTEFVAQLHPALFGRLNRFRSEQAAFIDPVLARFDREAQFCLAWHALLAPLRAAGLPFCTPRVSASAKTPHDDDAFDLALALKLVRGGLPVVCNDLHMDGAERMLVVSGPNGGGKTTFARCFGQLHYLAALGLTVPGRNARLFLPDAVFSHFEREEHGAASSGEAGRGKLEDELVRIRDILARATGRSVIVLNEIFASTTLDDAVFLGREVARRIVALGCLCVCVTFMTELSALGPETVSAVSLVDPGDPARRTHQVVRRRADGISHAASLARKHGLTAAGIRARLAAGPGAEASP